MAFRTLRFEFSFGRLRDEGLTMDDTDFLVEALARLRAIDSILGDPGGPRHPRDYWDTERQIRWVEPLAVDPPNWGSDDTPILVREEELDALVEARARELRQCVRAEEAAYQKRVKQRINGD